ncbi:TetR family transcriptional regulator [Cellulomonas uda]|uniref:TetR family transcriptional regulator n=2 Tax=Cellulomonadaceae TaxID=85016 RepID=A0A4Y3KA50_CELUD|nr:TetR family transcriptional regulator [Cellulomonas uda]
MSYCVPMAPDVSLRERKRRAIQDEVSQAAIDLFLTQGFDETPVGQIAAKVGMSERTFFRYFATKDDVIDHVSDRWRRRVVLAFAERPADEPVWTALRRAFDDYIAETAATGQSLPVMRVIYKTPALHGRHMARQFDWRADLTEALLAREPQLDPFVALTVVGAAVGCFDAARETWARSDGARALDVLFDEAMAAVAAIG